MKAVDRALGEALLAGGHLDAQALAVAQAVAARRGESLALALAHIELLEPALLRAAQSEALGHVLAPLSAAEVDPQLAQQWGGAACRRHRMLPLRDGALAVVDPDDLLLRDALAALGWEGERRRVEASAFERVWSALFAAPASAPAPADWGDAVVAVRALLGETLRADASDLHIEPLPDCARVRLRVDGVLRVHTWLDREQWRAVVSRLKVLAELDIADARSAQDGRFSEQLGGEAIDCRLSILPTDCGEAAVVRLHRRARALTRLDALGLSAAEAAALRALAAVPAGLLLIAGPTGSGKTTTLYALVDEWRGAGVNIVTLEDPVETPARWLRQTSISRALALDFAAGVRAALRQDPDAMLIGEIRDAETARMALRAAMTGHRVLSTVHATSAPGALGRLLDLGLSLELLLGNLVGVAAQRLVRRLCRHCRRGPDSDEWRAGGCAHCAHSGYRGRRPLLELLPLDAALEGDLCAGLRGRALAAALAQRGHVDLHQRAVACVRRGSSSRAEIERVLGPLATGERE